MPTTNDDVYDVTILGAGPTGLFGAFYAGMREMKTKIIEALPEMEGQLTVLYPEKFIYDVPGYPKILAKDLVKRLVEQGIQWGSDVYLDERIIGLKYEDHGEPGQGRPPVIRLTAENGNVHLTHTVVICAGIGAFSPNKLDRPGVHEYEGRGVAYFVREKAPYRGKNVLIVGGGDSAVDWALNLKDWGAPTSPASTLPATSSSRGQHLTESYRHRLRPGRHRCERRQELHRSQVQDLPRPLERDAHLRSPHAPFPYSTSSESVVG